MQRNVTAMAMAAVLAAGSVLGHGATDFIDMDSYSTLDRGAGEFYVQYDYMADDSRDPDADHWEFTPGFSVGITDRLMADMHVHLAKFGPSHIVEDRRDEYGGSGPSPFFEAVAASLQYRLPAAWPVQLAVIARTEAPLARARDLLGSRDWIFGGTLVASRDWGERATTCANLNVDVEGSETDWGWALGAAIPLSADPHGIAGSIEVTGDFEGDRWSVLPGVHAPLREGVIAKVGLETGRERGEDGDWATATRLSVSLLYGF